MVAIVDEAHYINSASSFPRPCPPPPRQGPWSPGLGASTRWGLAKPSKLWWTAIIIVHPTRRDSGPMWE
eukprot:2278589-Amphidinium_carterae.1